MKSLRQAAGIVVENNQTSGGSFMSFMQNIKGMLADSSDASMLSSKRVIAFLAFLALLVSFFIDQFTSYKVDADLFNAMMWIVIGGLGITGAEKFAPKK